MMMTEKPTYEEKKPISKVGKKEAPEFQATEQPLGWTDQKMAVILDSLLEHVVYQDMEMNILWANQAACQSVGMKRENLIGRPCYEVWTDRKDTCEDCPVAKARATGKAHKVEKMTPDGRWWHVQGYPVRDDNGNTKAMVELTLDITERKRSEERSKENESKLNALLVSIPDHMSMMDKAFNILWANDTAKSLFGNDIIGKKCYEVYHRRTSPCEPQPCIMGKTFKTGKSHAHVTEVITNDGRSIHYHCTASVALKDYSGRPTTVLEISRDVTKEKKLESELKLKAAELGIKSQNLEETNTALRVLLDARKRDKADLEEKVLSNVKELVLPYVDRLKKSSLDNKQMACIDILKSNLENIVSPFVQKLSSKYLGLTPREIQVANLVREGKTTKEIAEFMNSAAKTVEFHRDNIRKKLGINKTGSNLRTYLLSM